MTTNDSATTHWPHLTDDWDHRNHFLRTALHRNSNLNQEYDSDLQMNQN